MGSPLPAASSWSRASSTFASLATSTPARTVWRRARREARPLREALRLGRRARASGCVVTASHSKGIGASYAARTRFLLRWWAEACRVPPLKEALRLARQVCPFEADPFRDAEGTCLPVQELVCETWQQRASCQR